MTYHEPPAYPPTGDTELDLAGFRAAFPALRSLAWLDTPGCPPLARPVRGALQAAIEAWDSGDFSWVAWDEVPAQARVDLADLLGTAPENLALVGSVSEAAATVARSLPRGSRVLVDPEEFRSNLLPWLASAATGQIELLHPEGGSPSTLTERLCDGLVEGVDLITLSTARSSTGVRPDLAAVAARARSVGARMFLNATQSFGVLRLDLAGLRPDYLAVHGYKWMLAPRGCAWLHVRSDRVDALEPLAPGWHTVAEPNRGYFGADQPWATNASKLDGPLPWLPWIGGRAAIALSRAVDPQAVEQRALHLARVARDGLRALGIKLAETDQDSHIVRMYAPGSDRLARALHANGVVASGNPDGLRIGFHGFNDDDDVTRFLDTVVAWRETGMVK